MSYRELFEAELARYDIAWCRDGCGHRGREGHVHSRAFASGRTVHFSREVTTRATLQVGLHEIAHIVLGHTLITESGKTRVLRLRRFEREAQAEQWSRNRMRELDIPVPRKSTARGNAYVAREKRRGDNIIRARRRSK